MQQMVSHKAGVTVRYKSEALRSRQITKTRKLNKEALKEAAEEQTEVSWLCFNDTTWILGQGKILSRILIKLKAQVFSTQQTHKS